MSTPAPGDRDKDRIAPVDGLRAVAVIGVIWAHVWAFSGTPVISLGRIGPVELDVNRAISVIGTGVDLFFVISGFCMYMMYARRESVFSWSGFAWFVKRRWLRIAPAFYAAAVAAAVGFVVAGLPFPVLDLGAHLVFLHTVIPGTGTLAAPFWSLATEWHFYLVLPFLLWTSSRFGFWPMIAVGAVACLAFRFWMYAASAEVEALAKTQIPSRLVEFLWGMAVANLYSRRRVPPAMFRAGVGFVAGVAVVYAGRLMMVSEVLRAAGAQAYLLKVLAEPVMTVGYALLLWNVVSDASWFRTQLSRPTCRIIGRWSYSLYLWHWWPSVWISTELAQRFGSNVWTQYAALAACLAVVVPVAWLSYRFLELPYFESRSRPRLMAEVADSRA